MHAPVVEGERLHHAVAIQEVALSKTAAIEEPRTIPVQGPPHLRRNGTLDRRLVAVLGAQGGGQPQIGTGLVTEIGKDILFEGGTGGAS